MNKQKNWLQMGMKFYSQLGLMSLYILRLVYSKSCPFYSQAFILSVYIRPFPSHMLLTCVQKNEIDVFVSPFKHPPPASNSSSPSCSPAKRVCSPIHLYISAYTFMNIYNNNNNIMII